MPRPSARQALSLLAAVLLAGPAVAKSSNDPSFRLVNRGNAPVAELYVTPAGDANWGRDRLRGRAIPPNDSFEVRRATDGNCIFDVRAVFANRRTEERRGINTCQVEEVAVGRPEAGLKSGPNDPSFRLVNRGTVPIRELFATPSGRANWGQNRLAGPLPPEATTAVRIPPSEQCIFDLRVVFADRRALEKRRADLCRIADLPVP